MSNVETIPPTGWRIWWLAARPRTLPAAIVPVLVGSAVSAREGRFSWPVFLAALSVSLLLQIAANYANDLFDFLKGADHQRQGPRRVIQSGLVTPRQMRVALSLVIGAAAMIGLYLVGVGGWPIALIGVLSILGAVAYTAGPFPLAYHSLGDAAAFVFFGLIAVAGTAYLHAGAVSTTAILAALPVALLVTAIIVVNNLRDIETDRQAHKFTLAVRIGDGHTRLEYSVLLLGAYLFPIGLSMLTGVFPGWWWLPFITLPLALDLARTVRGGQRGAALNHTLARTAQLHLYFGALLAVALLLS